MRLRSLAFSVTLAVLQLSASLLAVPTTAYEAEMLVTGWLKADPEPLETALGREVATVETFTDDTGEPAYYVVYLRPSGFVIVAADDMLEPIIGFADDGVYDPAPDNPLSALVTKDMSGRIAAVRSSFGPLAMPPRSEPTAAQEKWNYFVALGCASGEEVGLMGMPALQNDDLSDVRVSPLVQSKWGQGNCGGSGGQPVACYNYFTPQFVGGTLLFHEGDEDNYPCGCVATVMAQLMRYHMYPQQPAGQREFTITVDGFEAKRSLLGGFGPGGAYNWNDMVFDPGPGTTDAQRRAIGAICHDAGVAVGMQYRSDGSGAYLYDAATALVDTFGFSSAVWAEDAGNAKWSRDLLDMINPNLDAGLPVFLGFTNYAWWWVGHAAVCDGYGYNVSTPYHHLNMGWRGEDDCWYNLPNISIPDEFTFDVINRCIYNITPRGAGEIISGRVIDSQGRAIADIPVTARNKVGGSVHTAVTNRRGIYAITGLDSGSTYAVSASEFGYDFYLSAGYGSELAEVTTGSSESGNDSSGNKWAVDFVAYESCRTVTVGRGTSQWDYPMHTDNHDGRTQTIYLAEEIGTAGTVTALALDVADVPGGPLRYWTIRMKHTPMSEYGPCALSATGWTTVYRGNRTVAGPGWQSFEFQTPFEYNGTDNLLVDFSHNGSSANRSGACKVSKPGGTRSVYAVSDSEHQDPLRWPGSDSPAMQCSDNVPNVRLSLCGESQVVRGDIKLTASDGGAGDHFGCSVSLSGDYAIVGAYGHNGKRGAAYIFKREGVRWTEQAKLRALSGECFGSSVSIYGDYAVIGAGNTRTGGTAAGSFTAYVLKREGTGWTLQTELRGGGVGRSEHFGCSVSISGDYAIAGAPRDDEEVDGNIIHNTGSVCLYRRGGTDWIYQGKLRASEGQRYDYIGDSVSIFGDYVIAAGGYPSTGVYGPVYIFGSNGTDWVEQCKFSSSGLSFGYAVSISADYAVIGAPDEDNDDGERSGTAHVYKRAGTSWTEQPGLIGMDSAALDCFGSSASISGDLIIVGAPYDDDDANFQSKDVGSAYVFRLHGTGFRQQAKLSASDATHDGHFGNSLSMDGDCVIIGAEDNDDKGRDSGSVYIFRRIGEVWVP